MANTALVFAVCSFLFFCGTYQLVPALIAIGGMVFCVVVDKLWGDVWIG
jgi:hypothetical protein